VWGGEEGKERQGMPAWRMSVLEKPPSGVNTFPGSAIDMARHKQTGRENKRHVQKHTHGQSVIG